MSRFGIGKDDYETLEAIGQRYGITRERVRQIEADALKHVKSASNESIIKPVVTALNDFIKSNGGVMDENELKASFASTSFETKPEASNKYEGATMFFLNLAGSFVPNQRRREFLASLGFRKFLCKTQEALVAHLTAQLKKKKSCWF